MLKIQRLTTSDHDFWAQLDSLFAWDTIADDSITQTVRDILQNVRHKGDTAQMRMYQKFVMLGPFSWAVTQPKR